MADKFNFTKTALGNLPRPLSGRAMYYDTTQPGLALQVTPKGVKTFYYLKWAAGRTVKVFLGRSPTMSIDMARKRAVECQAAANQDRIPRRQRGDNGMTLGELWTIYRQQWELQRSRSRTQVTNGSRYETCLKPWAKKRLADITKDQVHGLHSEIGRLRGEVTANRAIQLLRRLYNFAIQDLGKDWLKNPAKGQKLFPEEKRKRFLKGDELPMFFEAVMAEPDEEACDFVLVTLFTGARRSNVQRMRWEELDLEKGLWTIPANEFKTGKQKEIVLAQPVLDLLCKRLASKVGPWVFPGNGGVGYLKNPRCFWKRIVERAGLKDLHIHDLRRSLGSWQAALGASLPIIGKSLGHESPAATEIYARLDLEPVRNSVEAAIQAMLQAGKVHNVIPAPGGTPR